MFDTVVARRYARAFYNEAANRDLLAAALAGLGEFAALFQKRPELPLLLLHPAIPADVKNNILAAVTDVDLCRDFLRLLLAKGRLRLVPAIYHETRDIYRQRAGILAVEVTTAAPLDDDVRAELAAVLGRLSGKNVELDVHTDAALIGGVRLRVGDVVVDGTLAGRLRRLRAAMAGEAAA